MFVRIASIIFTSRSIRLERVQIVAHGGAVGLIAEAGALLAIVGLWGWVWWRSRGAADDDHYPRTTNPPYRRPAATASDAAVPAIPSPKGAARCRDDDPREHERVPARPAAEGRDRDGDDGERAEAVAGDGEDRAGKRSRCSWASGIASAPNEPWSGTAIGDARGEPGVDEGDRRGRADAVAQQRDPAPRSGPSAGRRRGSTRGRPGHSTRPRRPRRAQPRRGREGGERRAPGREVGGATLAPALQQAPGQPQRHERSGEGEEGVHGRGA